MSVLSGIDPQNVMGYFEDICSIPHGSGNTGIICDYCVDFAVSHGLEYKRDKYNNVIIKKRASVGHENAPKIIVQGHLDMVCEKSQGRTIDFEKEAIELKRDGDWIYANGTTLGGDDGIAVAMMLAVLDDNSLAHPAITAVFTSDEETGMTGARCIELSRSDGNMLLNIDSEEENVFTVSCAGGLKSQIFLPLISVNNDLSAYEISVTGLKGGHSGTDINKNRLNANFVMLDFLKGLYEKSDFNICSVCGGTVDNAIPSECRCVIAYNGKRDSLEALCNAIQKDIICEAEPDLTVSVSKCKSKVCFDAYSTAKYISFTAKLPNGVVRMSDDIEGLVQTSLNLGIIRSNNSGIDYSFALRSSSETEKNELAASLRAETDEFGAVYSESGSYPAWEYKHDSKLRDCMVKVHCNMYGYPPRIEAIHAGLECGLLAGKIHGLDAVSFGPDIKDIHTSAERMSISSVERTYKFLCNVLRELK